MKQIDRKFLLGLFIVVVFVGVGFWYLQNNKPNSDSTISEKKTPHFQDSTPAHDDIYSAQPINVTLNFDANVTNLSEVRVSGLGKDWTEGDLKITNNKTTLQKNLKQGMGNGTYLVRYKACWEDKTCNSGNFSFRIDTTKREGFKDLRGRNNVTIKMQNIRFEPEKVIISPGTMVTWLNEDSEAHFVNTDTHPYHTYIPEMNSESLGKGKNYSFTFQTKGQYNYHCSAHLGMHGIVVVDD